VPRKGQGPADSGEDDGRHEPKSDDDLDNADLTLGTDSDPDALARHASSGDESVDPDVRSGPPPPSDDGSPDPETDVSESDEPASGASTAEAVD
jgi:hypothetical protein